MTDPVGLDRRGVSEVVGFTLVFALVLSMVALISVVGFADLDNARENEQANNAERAFDVVVDNIADIYRRSAPSRGTELRLAEASVYTGESVSINVTGIDSSTGNAFTTADVEINPIIYRGQSGTQIVYSGGGLFRVQQRGGLVVREPPFVITDDYVQIPVIQTRTRNQQSISGGTARVLTERSLGTTLAYDREGSYDQLWINVTSPRYELWHEYLSEESATDCTLEPSHESVVCDLGPSGGAPQYLTIRQYRINVNLER